MLRRIGRFTAGATIATTAAYWAITTSPLESTPSFLFPVRVTSEGIVRACRVAYLGAVTAYEYHVKLAATPQTQKDWDVAHEVTATRLVALAERCGGCYIKVAQAFAAGSDVLPPIYCRILRKLQADVDPRPFSEMLVILRREFGDDVIGSKFEWIDEKPLGCASVAQVHRARIKGSGDEVAVKMQKLEVAAAYDGDLAVILFALRVCGKIFPGFDWSPFISSCEDTLYKELDFEIEHEHLLRIDRDMRALFGDKVVCPKVYEKLSTKTVLTTEFIDGCHGGDLVGIRDKLKLDVRTVATLLSDAFAYQLFQTGFAACDCHSGNILIRKHPRDPSQPQCVLIDHGLSFEIDAKERKILADVWTASATRNDEALQSIMEHDLGLDPKEYEVLGSIFLQTLYSSFSPFKLAATQAEVDLIREGYSDPRITAMIEKFPTSFLLALSTISQYRAVHKLLGNPVSRTARMLRISMRNGSERLRPSFLGLQWQLAKLWLTEKWTAAVLAFALWWDPSIAENVPDELLQLA